MKKFFIGFSVAAVSSLTLAQAPQAANAKGLKLTLKTSEPFIQKGQLKLEIIQKSFLLEPKELSANNKITAKLSQKLESIFKGINRVGKDARFENEKGSWVARQRSAWQVNQAQTRENILKAIESGAATAEISLDVTTPKRNVRNWAESGITTLFAKGSSSFKGSPSFRVKNIIVAASKLDNDYLEESQELDFNDSIGAINKATGFVEGFVIVDGTLEKEDGGGICQVSTTLFRAAYNGGLPITERHEHSHRVSYYDPVGFEATVYAPSKNLKFKNDSGGTLLIQAEWNEKAQTLGFFFFGRAPNRQVSVSAPVISDFKAAAAPSFSADPKMRLGASRQIDSPMQGMTSLIIRTIRKDGKVSKDTLKSVYQPWGAVYAVHPNDQRLR